MVARAEAAAATRERILEAAWRRFSKDVYEGVRLTDIASDAGVSEQTIYTRFGSKDQLFVFAWAWAIGPEGERRDQAPVGDVRKAVRLLYDSYEAQGDAGLRLLAEEDRIPTIRQMADAGRAWHRAGSSEPSLRYSQARAAPLASAASSHWSSRRTSSSGSCCVARWSSTARRPSES